jgi:NAD(P)-dependent dehydrogenase (short-subunit alcohol dehydrogenase family)
MPSQQGRIVVITGGTEGLGFEDALALSRAGAEVIIASRNAGKGASAVSELQARVSGARVRFEQLDLASLESVAAFSKRLASQLPRIDVLINNAGIMTPPERRTTSDGFELQFGLNFLGHYALTAQLMPLLRAGKNPRVVTLSSVANRNGTIRFDDLQWERIYEPMPAYAQSKLADLLFAREFQLRSVAERWDIMSVAAHPGVSRTNLLLNGPGQNSPQAWTRRLFGRVLFQPSERGALPTLFAATAPDAEAGGYYGPNRLQETRGNVAPARVPEAATDAKVASRLWSTAEQLTGISF